MDLKVRILMNRPSCRQHGTGVINGKGVVVRNRVAIVLMAFLFLFTFLFMFAVSAAPANAADVGTVTLCREPGFVSCATVNAAVLPTSCTPVSRIAFPQGVRSAINNSTHFVEFYHEYTCTDLEARLIPLVGMDADMRDAFYLRVIRR
jgi:hypothetical protein